MKKVREENIPLINYISEVKDGDVSDNQDVQRYFCSDKSFVNGIAVTVLTGDYLPPLILAEVPYGEGIVQKYIVDGLQRTTALMMIRYGNHKFTGNFEDNLIEYQAKKLNEDGSAVKDEDGNFIWEKKVFDIKNKTYDDLPKELKNRIDTYQLRIATYQNCTMEKVSKLVRKLNQHKSMNISQQSITWIPTYARKIKQIADGKFFKNSIIYNDNHRRNGEYLQVVCRSVMNIFHINDYKKEAKKIANYLEDNSSVSEFETIQRYFERIESVCKDSCKNIFVKKDIPVWLAVFDKFTKIDKSDTEFAKFVMTLERSLHNKVVNGTSYDELNQSRGTTDKSLVTKKIDVYTTLMMNYFGINNELESRNPVESMDIEIENTEEITLSFVQKNVNSNVIEEDIECYEGMIDDCVRVDSEVYKKCKTALVALMAYACKNEKDMDFERWIQKYQKNSSGFSEDQKKNYTYMRNSFDSFVKRG